MTGRPAPHVPLSAVLLIVVSVALFSCTESVIKSLTQRYPVPLLLWVRFAMQALIVLALFGPRMGMKLARSPQLGLQIWRGVTLIGSSACFYQALRQLPLADATAIIYTTPVFVIALSVIVLKERLTRPRMAFVVAGFAGMLLIARPGLSIVQGAALLALVSAAFYAVFQILTRRLHGEDPRVTVFIPALSGAVLTLPLLLLVDFPVAIALQDFGLLALMGGLGTTAHFIFIRAFRSAPASALTPFTYTQLVWAVLLGWLVFGQFPDGYALAGIATIASSGLLLAFHERRRTQIAQVIRDPIAPD